MREWTMRVKAFGAALLVPLLLCVGSCGPWASAEHLAATRSLIEEFEAEVPPNARAPQIEAFFKRHNIQYGFYDRFEHADVVRDAHYAAVIRLDKRLENRRAIVINIDMSPEGTMKSYEIFLTGTWP